MSDFCHLHTHSHYSLLDGLMSIDEICEAVVDLGQSAIALTDHGNLYGLFKFWSKAQLYDLKPILGCEFYVATDHTKKSKGHSKRWHIVLLARNEEGYHNLIELSTRSFEDGFYYKPRIDRALMDRYKGGLICLSACPAGEVGEAVLANNARAAREAVVAYREIFDPNYYLEIQPQIGLEEYNDRIIRLSNRYGVPLVATCDAHFRVPEDYEFHRILLKVNTKGSFEYRAPNIWLMSADQVLENLMSLGVEKSVARKAIENTVEIADEIEHIEIDCSLKLPLYEA